MDRHAEHLAFRRHLELVQADLVAVVRKHAPVVGHRVICHALIETTGHLVSAIATANPAMRADLDRKFDQLRLFVSATEAPPQ
jgi:hypothetical protein